MVPCERSCHKKSYVQYESLISSDKEVMAMVKVFQKKVKVTRSEIMVPCERSCHKK